MGVMAFVLFIVICFAMCGGEWLWKHRPH